MISIGEEFVQGLIDLFQLVAWTLPFVCGSILLVIALYMIYTRVVVAFFEWAIPSQWHWFTGSFRRIGGKFFGAFKRKPRRKKDTGELGGVG